jgi:hypothetical protein
MSQYVRLSDLGETELTFDAEQAPPLDKRKRIAEPSREEMVLEERRKRTYSDKKPSSQERRKRREETPIEDRDLDHESKNFDHIDNVLYETPVGASASHQVPLPSPPPTITQDNPNQKFKGGVIEILPYVAGVVILAALIFLMSRNRGN